MANPLAGLKARLYPKVPQHLKARWLAVAEPRPPFAERSLRFRTQIIPWLDHTAPLAGQNIVEIGSGMGPSTVALAEQGASVIAVDLNDAALSILAGLAATLDVDVEIRNANAAAPDTYASDRPVDQVIFWAALEHMTLDERLDAIRSAAAAIRPGGLMTVIETPNRLWPFDAHTSRLPFFAWLPQDLAFAYSAYSPRETFGGRYLEPTKDSMLDFARRGHGVSYHEFAVALGAESLTWIVSNFQGFWRSNPIYQAGFAVSGGGATQRVLKRHATADRPIP